MGSIQKPVAAKAPSSLPDDSTSAAPPKPTSPGILSTGLSRAIVISAVLIVVTMAALLVATHRYAMTSGTHGETAVVYRLNTLTGKLYFCTPVQCSPVPDKNGQGS